MQLVPLYTPPVVTNDVAIVTTYPLEKLLSVSIPLTLLVRISEFKLVVANFSLPSLTTVLLTNSAFLRIFSEKHL